MVLQACLNGDRDAGVPLTPEELAADGAACIAAGAVSIHVHPRDADGARDARAARTSPRSCARCGRCGVEISLSTGLWITGGDVDARAAAIAGWTERPDLVSLNFSEEGWRELADAAQRARHRDRGRRSGPRRRPRCWPRAGSWRCGAGLARDAPPPAGAPHPRRAALGEPRRGGAGRGEIDAALDAAAIPTPRLHHGVGPATWAVLDAAVPRGREIRIGLEDVLTLPDGRRAPDNAALVVEAVLRYR